MTRDAKQNTPLEADVRSAFSAILAFEAELASERGTYMQRCARIRGQIADVYDEGKAKGITKKVLKATVKEHGLRAKLDACRGDLEADEQHEYDMLVEQLGDLAGTPLGEATLAQRAAKPARAKKSAALDSLAQ